MRFSLDELKKLVVSKLKDGSINKPIEGYPLLHRIFMELADEAVEDKKNEYYYLIETILASRIADPDCVNHHKQSLLYAAADRGDLRLINLLLHYGANPNFLTPGKETPLERAIYCAPTSIDAIKKLLFVTKSTKQLKDGLQYLFDQAVEEEEINWINVLLDFQLVDYMVPSMPTGSAEISHEFARGFWIRTINDINNECRILSRRSNLHPADLAKQRHALDNKVDPTYTKYSPATFVVSGIPIHLFNHDSAGLMIRRLNSAIPYWYDGHREELTDNFSFKPGIKLDNKNTGQYYEISEDDIRSYIINKYNEEVEKLKLRSQDHHGVLFNKRLQEIAFNWNEGLFRYRYQGIFGIIVNPNNRRSCTDALNFRKVLKYDFPLYCYSKGSLVRVQSADLKQRWRMEKSSTSSAQAITQLSGRYASSSSRPASSRCDERQQNEYRRSKP